MAVKQLSILDFFGLESAFATEFRRLLVGLKRAAKGNELKSILITSATLSEGKSTICSFLGLTAAKRGLKTLLIDCDLRRPSLHRNFALTRQPGLAEILSEGAATKGVIKRSGQDKLDIITAGKTTAQPAETFDSKAIGVLVTEMKFYYDLILLDCAPVIPVSDPMLLAQEVDGVLLVIKAGETQRELVKRANDIIQLSSGNVVGAIMNNMTGSLPSYYDYSRYEYYAEPDEKPKVKRTPEPKPGKDSTNSQMLTDSDKASVTSQQGKQKPFPN